MNNCYLKYYKYYWLSVEKQDPSNVKLITKLRFVAIRNDRIYFLRINLPSWFIKKYLCCFYLVYFNSWKNIQKIIWSQ